MRIQQSIGGRVLAIAFVLISVILTFRFVATTIKRWEFKNLGGHESRFVSEGDAQSQVTESLSTSSPTPQTISTPTISIYTPSPAEIQIPVSGSSEAYIVEVLHIENGALRDQCVIHIGMALSLFGLTSGCVRRLTWQSIVQKLPGHGGCAEK